MNCPKCGREMLISHIVREETDGEERVKKVYTCVNRNCGEYSSECRIKERNG